MIPNVYFIEGLCNELEQAANEWSDIPMLSSFERC
jgi:hypothetical protein